MHQGPRPSTWPGDSDAPGPGSSSGERAPPGLHGAPFEVVRTLGKGGMGAVYEVRRPGDPRRLAAKLLTLTSPQARARFEREGEVVARLEHPGIIPVLGSGSTAAGAPYLLFEFVDGKSLQQVLQEAREPLPEETVLDWGEQLARALGHAHAHGIVHRDVKPANIMLDRAGRVRVADFGIALAADLDRLTRTGQMAGTPLYMAPEQFSGDLPIGPWTDVHAVGSVLYEALAGQAPYDAPTAANMVAAILHGEPPPLRQARRDISPGAAAVITRCLEKDPDGRYPDGAALACDLARLRRGERVSAVSTFLRAARRRTLRRGALVAGAVALLVGLPLAVALVVLGERQARARDEALAQAVSDLDGLAAQVRPDAGERALDLVARELQRAEALLVAAPQGPARERLADAAAALAARRDLALATQRARAAMRTGAHEPAALAAALEALARVPPPPGAMDLETTQREEARAWLLFQGGRLAEARAAAARLAAASPAPGDDAEAWLAEPGHRAAWLLAWCALREGDAAERARRAAALPPALRVRLASAALAAAPDAAAARARAEVERARSGLPAGPDADLLDAALAVDDLLRAGGRVELAAALEALERVRRVSDPPSPGRVPRTVEAQAALLEGEVHLAIGWPASAAEAFARAARLQTGAPVAWPSAPLRLPGGRPLLAPDTAARLGEALARALDPEPEAAAASAALARGRLALDHLPAAPDLEDLARSATALQLDGPWTPRVDDLVAWGEADLAAAAVRRGRDAEHERADPAPLLARAAHALRLAARLAGDGAVTARAAAALARAEAALGRPEPAAAALEVARRLDPRGWRTLHAEAAVAVARAQAEEAIGAAEAAVEALAAAAPRAIERGELTGDLLLSMVDALEAGGHAVDALRVLDLASRCADRDRLAFEARAALHQRLERQAATLRRADLARAASERVAALKAVAARLNAASRLIASQTAGAGGQFADTPELREAYALLLAESPQQVSTYISHHVLYGRLRAEGFDDLALGFECNAATVIDYLNDPSFALRRMARTEAEAAAASILLLLEDMQPDPSHPVPRDGPLRRALAGLYCADLRIPLDAPRLAGCLLAARDAWGRRPMSEPASLVLGRLLQVAGAPADALPLLRRADDLRPLCPPDRARQGAWTALYEALALAALRRWDEAHPALTRARERGLTLSHRIREEPLLREDRALVGTLMPWAVEEAKAVEARFGAR
ncbi:MAG: serine/threonine protein kinase [Planctomycetes bacterium]|nr:serine/threonine protein kinase [Planctomycetota bacterium]